MIKHLQHIFLRLLCWQFIAQAFLPIFLAIGVIAVKQTQYHTIQNKTYTNVHTIVLTATDFAKLTFVETTECVYNNQLHDVISITKQGNNYILKTLVDTKETVSINALKELYNALKKIIELFVFLYIEPVASIVYHNDDSTLVHCVLQKTNTCAPFLQIVIPPPEYFAIFNILSSRVL